MFGEVQCLSLPTNVPEAPRTAPMIDGASHIRVILLSSRISACCPPAHSLLLDLFCILYSSLAFVTISALSCSTLTHPTRSDETTLDSSISCWAPVPSLLLHLHIHRPDFRVRSSEEPDTRASHQAESSPDGKHFRFSQPKWLQSLAMKIFCITSSSFNCRKNSETTDMSLKTWTC